MPKKSIIAATFIITAMLAACGDKDEVTNLPSEVADDSAYAFQEFSLDVDYSGNKSYEASYDNDKTQNKTEASIDDTVNGEKLEGNDAFTKLDAIFKQLTFDKDTPNDDVINEVIAAFNLDPNFTKFELEVQFLGGVEKDYDATK